LKNTNVRGSIFRYEVYGQVKTFPLIENGGDIPVTNDNRRGMVHMFYALYSYFFKHVSDYVDLYIKHYVNISVKRQFDAFYRGFHRVCGGRALKVSLLGFLKQSIYLCLKTE
jgi:ubiquitin-protein ligase E3 A